MPPGNVLQLGRGFAVVIERCSHKLACPNHFFEIELFESKRDSDTLLRCCTCGDPLNAAHPSRDERSSCRGEPHCTPRGGCAFLRHVFSPLASHVADPASRIKYILGRKPPYSPIGRPADSSLIFPRTLYSVLESRWSMWIPRCHRAGSSQPCPYKRSLFRYRGGASLYPRTTTRSYRLTAPSSWHILSSIPSSRHCWPARTCATRDCPPTPVS